MKELREKLFETIVDTPEPCRREAVAITNLRHQQLLEQAREALVRARGSLEAESGPVPEEFLLTDLQDARLALEEVTGKRSSEDLLSHIFSRFCIGK